MRRVQVRYRTSADAAQCVADSEAGGRIGMATTPRVRCIGHRCACDLLPFSENVRRTCWQTSYHTTYVNLRLTKARNGQVKRTRDASDYRDPWRMFGPVARLGSTRHLTHSISPLRGRRPLTSARTTRVPNSTQQTHVPLAVWTDSLSGLFKWAKLSPHSSADRAATF